MATLQAKANGGALLPAGVALNINFPKFDAGASTALPWAFARHGSYDYLTLKFVSDLSRDPVAKSFGLGSYAYPGLTFNFTTAAERHNARRRRQAQSRSRMPARPSDLAQFAQQNTRPSPSTPWPMTRQPPAWG